MTAPLPPADKISHYDVCVKMGRQDNSERFHLWHMLCSKNPMWYQSSKLKGSELGCLVSRKHCADNDKVAFKIWYNCLPISWHLRKTIIFFLSPSYSLAIYAADWNHWNSRVWNKLCISSSGIFFFWEVKKWQPLKALSIFAATACPLQLAPLSLSLRSI